jgi:N-methylhydantoinase B
MCTQEPAIAYNAGLVRPLKVKIPKGNLLRADPGAAYGARYSTSQKVCDVTMGALAQAVSDEIPAFDSGQGSILLVSIPDFDTGTTKVSVVQPIVGGSGARPREDGVDGTMVILNFLKNVPTESLENDMPPILIRHYGLRQDSGGAGKYRGGTGIEIELQTFSPYTTITSRCMERYIFPPPGRLGGEPGATGYTTLNPGAENETDIGKIDVLELNYRDILRIGTPGGGGFGDPTERPIKWVENDVKNEIVSLEAAERFFGVVFNENKEVDLEKTNQIRQDIRRTRSWSKPPEFTFGAAREAFRNKWSVDLEDAINEAVSQYPGLLRQYLHQMLKERIKNEIQIHDDFQNNAIHNLLEEIKIDVQAGYPVSRT